MSNGQQVIDNSLFDESNLEPENGFAPNENIENYIFDNLIDENNKIVDNKGEFQKVAEAEEYMSKVYQDKYRAKLPDEQTSEDCSLELETICIYKGARDFIYHHGNNKGLDSKNIKDPSIFDANNNTIREKYNQNFNKAFEKKFEKQRNTKNQEQIKITTKAHIDNNEQTASSTKKKEISFKKFNELVEKQKDKKEEFLNKIFKKSNTKPLKHKKIQKNLVNNMKKVKSSSTKVDQKFTQVELLDKKRLNLNPNLRVPKKKNKIPKKNEIPNTWKNIPTKGQYNGTKNILNRVKNDDKYQLFCQNNYR